MITRSKVGIVFPDLSSGESIFSLITTAAQIQDQIDIILFYENHERPPLPLPCASMQINEIWSFKGPIIATNLSTATKVLAATSPNPKFFYCYDIEWTRLQRKDYHFLKNIYRNPDLKLISRCHDHTIIVEDCWNTKVFATHNSWEGILKDETICSKIAQEIPFLTYGGRKRVPEISFL